MDTHRFLFSGPQAFMIIEGIGHIGPIRLVAVPRLAWPRLKQATMPRTSIFILRGEFRHNQKILLKLNELRDFPGGPVVKNLLCNPEDIGSIPGQGTKIDMPQSN